MITTTPERMLSLKDVLDATALSPATIYRLISQGRFPRQVRVSIGRVAWIEREVTEWQRDTIAKRWGNVEAATDAVALLPY